MQSKGERIIEKILKENKLIYKKEVKFQDLKSLIGEFLRFDFVLYDNNKKIICCIEYDGIQHFQRIPHFQKTIFDFKKTKEWDRRKNSYCLKNKIPLIRIPYWDLQDLTLKKIFETPEYRVTNIYHNDMIFQGVRG